MPLIVFKNNLFIHIMGTGIQLKPLDQSCSSLLMLSQVSRTHLHICTDPLTLMGAESFLQPTPRLTQNTVLCKHCYMQI